MRDRLVAHQSTADRAAQEWSFRVPWLFYEAFPAIENITKDDYFDEKHFSSGRVYREWNRVLDTRLQAPNTSVQHRMFILVGAARTLELTIES
jgi:hypothetical protein